MALGNRHKKPGPSTYFVSTVLRTAKMYPDACFDLIGIAAR